MQTFYKETMMNLQEVIDTALALLHAKEDNIGVEFSAGLPRCEYGSTFHVYGREIIGGITLNRILERGDGIPLAILSSKRAFVSNHVADKLRDIAMNPMNHIVVGLKLFFYNNQMFISIRLADAPPPTSQELFLMTRIGN